MFNDNNSPITPLPSNDVSGLPPTPTIPPPPPPSNKEKSKPKRRILSICAISAIATIIIGVSIFFLISKNKTTQNKTVEDEAIAFLEKKYGDQGFDMISIQDNAVHNCVALSCTTKEDEWIYKMQFHSHSLNQTFTVELYAFEDGARRVFDDSLSQALILSRFNSDIRNAIKSSYGSEVIQDIIYKYEYHRESDVTSTGGISDDSFFPYNLSTTHNEATRIDISEDLPFLFLKRNQTSLSADIEILNPYSDEKQISKAFTSVVRIVSEAGWFDGYGFTLTVKWNCNNGDYLCDTMDNKRTAYAFMNSSIGDNGINNSWDSCLPQESDTTDIRGPYNVKRNYGLDGYKALCH